MVEINRIIEHPLYVDDLKKINELNSYWGKLDGKTVLLIGATGLIGSCLVDLLMYRNEYFNSKINIIAVSRNRQRAIERFSKYWNLKNFRYIQHDCVKELPRSIGHVDFAIHAASNTHPVAYSSDPVGTITTNVFGTYFLLEFLKEQKNCRVLFVSSVEIYGENNTKKERFSEMDCGYINCNTMRAGYPESKRVSESLCQAYISKFEMDIVIARLCRVFGPTMLNSDSKALAQFIKKAVAGEDIVLKSEGKQFYSYIYVFDAVSALITILLNGKKGMAYNVADENSDITLRELANILSSYNKKNVIYEFPSKEEIKGYSMATKALLDSKMLKEIGWKANSKISNALVKCIEILRNK